MKKVKSNLALQIFIALVLAIIAGLLLSSQAAFANSYIKPFGTIFLNLLKFVVVPIVLFSIASGVISMQDVRKVGSVGGKTVVYYMCTPMINTSAINALSSIFSFKNTADTIRDKKGVRYARFAICAVFSAPLSANAQSR